MTKLFIYLSLLLNILTSPSQAQHPPAIGFLTIDLKYSKENGVKICEIQNGVSSTFKGDSFVHGDYGNICPNFVNVFSEFHMKKWSINKFFCSWQLNELTMKDEGWRIKKSFDSIVNDPEFIEAAKKSPEDPSDISSYSAMIFVGKGDILDFDSFKTKFPGVIIIDEPTYPYWQDKYKMSELFNSPPSLSPFKPEYLLCKKKYKKTLANEIIYQLPSERYVIKPRGTFLGNGVIILDAKDLDKTLKYILKKSRTLKKDSDKAYNYWYQDPFDSFIIEKFYASDPIAIPHLDNKTYQPTIRVAVIMIYDLERISMCCLGAYNQLPYFSTEQKGTLNDKHKSCITPPYFSKVNPEVVEEIYQQLNIALPLLFDNMIRRQTHPIP